MEEGGNLRKAELFRPSWSRAWAGAGEDDVAPGLSPESSLALCHWPLWQLPWGQQEIAVLLFINCERQRTWKLWVCLCPAPSGEEVHFNPIIRVPHLSQGHFPAPSPEHVSASLHCHTKLDKGHFGAQLLCSPKCLSLIQVVWKKVVYLQWLCHRALTGLHILYRCILWNYSHFGPSCV